MIVNPSAIVDKLVDSWLVFLLGRGIYVKLELVLVYLFIPGSGAFTCKAEKLPLFQGHVHKVHLSSPQLSLHNFPYDEH